MTASKIVLNAASGVGGAGLDVEEVFSTYLYTGTGANQTITNGIDLSGEGGLVWVKGRSGTTGSSAWGGDIGHNLFDSTAPQKAMNSAETNARTNFGAAGVNFTGTGFTVGYNGFNDLNYSSFPYVSWSFRKAEKFFDVVSYTGDGTTGQTINHNLGTNVGAIIIKCTDTGTNWAYWHRTFGSQEMIILNSTGASRTDLPYVSNVTDSSFTVNGSSSFVNENTKNHVAYLFAHNDGDGDFGPDADADIIKCGSYTGNGSADGPEIDLGFEPQWVLIKETDATGNWQLFDSMRGMVADGVDARIAPNLSNAEDSIQSLTPTATGFKINTTSGNLNTNNSNHIYIAIRRGTAVPESATEVFDISVTNYSANQTIAANIDVTDTFIVGRQPTSNNSNGLFLFSRLTGNKRLRTDQAFSENAELGLSGFDTQNGVVAGGSDSGQSVWNSGPFIKYFMKRAPNYFDVVAYNGDATSSPNSRNINHNLGVAPEMMWIKCRSAAENWAVYHSGIGATKYMNLNNTNAIATSANWWRNTAPTDTVFTIGHQDDVNLNGGTHTAYLFASLDGISKVGSVTHSGTTNVDCGFSSGARFVLLKRTDATSDWYFWDTTRGIVSGNDPYLTLNGTNQPEITNTDYIDPLSSGFTITDDFTDGDYIFYAIA